jgi:hypothetical protein
LVQAVQLEPKLAEAHYYIGVALCLRACAGSESQSSARSRGSGALRPGVRRSRRSGEASFTSSRTESGGCRGSPRARQSSPITIAWLRITAA